MFHVWSFFFFLRFKTSPQLFLPTLLLRLSIGLRVNCSFNTAGGTAEEPARAEEYFWLIECKCSQRATQSMMVKLSRVCMHTPDGMFGQGGVKSGRGSAAIQVTAWVKFHALPVKLLRLLMEATACERVEQEQRQGGVPSAARGEDLLLFSGIGRISSV